MPRAAHEGQNAGKRFSGMAWSLKAAEGQGIDGSRINEASILVDHERTGS